MELLIKLLEEFENEYNLKLCVIINGHTIYGNSEDKITNIPFKNGNSKANLLINKEYDDVSIKYLISVINNIYKEDTESELLNGCFNDSLNSDDVIKLEEFINHKEWYLLKLFTSKNVLYENIIDNIFECKYIVVENQSGIYILLENDNHLNNNLLVLKDMIEGELYIEVKLLYSNLINSLTSLKKSYDKLNQVSEIFNSISSSRIASENDFELELMIDMIEKENLTTLYNNITDIDLSELDVELLNTIDVFLKNNLSITNTSKELYVHRNTLIYRLDKIKQLTNLDIRIFIDAFWMVIAKTIYNKLK